MLRTSDGLSKVVTENQVWFSLILFAVIYFMLFILFLYLLNEKIQHGPELAETIPSEYEHQKQILEK